MRDAGDCVEYFFFAGSSRRCGDAGGSGKCGGDSRGYAKTYASRKKECCGQKYFVEQFNSVATELYRKYLTMEKMIEKVYKEIEQKFNEGKISPDIKEFSGNADRRYTGDGIEEILNALDRNFYVSLQLEKSSSVWKKKVKKVLNKIMGGVIKPILRDQNIYNAYLMEATEILYRKIEFQEKEIEELKRELKKEKGT